MAVPLTKIDAARRQLATAIRFFFNGGDSVSVLSLAANAWEVIDALCTRDGLTSMSAQARSYASIISSTAQATRSPLLVAPHVQRRPNFESAAKGDGRARGGAHVRF
jgi:hypothetical protein